jgi:transposase
MSTTPEQRAKIGQLKGEWLALVDRAVDELLENPERLEHVERALISLHYQRPLTTRTWWGAKLK